MKTRSQVKAGRRRDNIDREREVKQRLKLKKRIMSRGAASSYSSTSPNQNDGKSGGEPQLSNGKALSSTGKPVVGHDWSTEEVRCLLVTSAEDKWKAMHKLSGRMYSRQIAKHMNGLFGVEHFTEENVRSKVRSLHTLYTNHVEQSGSTQSSGSSHSAKVRSTIHLLKKHRDILSSVFIANKSTTSVQQQPEGWTEPGIWKKSDALKFMNFFYHTKANKLVDYSVALDSPRAKGTLDVFTTFPEMDFKERKQMLDKLVRDTKLYKQ